MGWFLVGLDWPLYGIRNANGNGLVVVKLRLRSLGQAVFEKGIGCSLD